MKSVLKSPQERKRRALPLSGRLNRQHTRLRQWLCALNILLIVLLLLVALLVIMGYFPPLAPTRDYAVKTTDNGINYTSPRCFHLHK